MGIEWADIQNSIPFNFRLKDKGGRIEGYARNLLKYIDLGTRKQDQKFEYLICLLINLKIGWDRKQYISISLDRNYYSKIPQRLKYSSLFFLLSLIITVKIEIDF